MLRLELGDMRRRGAAVVLSAAAAASGWMSAAVRAADGPEQAAAQALDAGRRAYNEARFDVAAEQFREFLKKFPNHKESAAALYGLGVALVAQADGDLPAAVAALTAASAAGAQKPMALYYLGAAERQQAGTVAGAEAAAKFKAAAGHLLQAAAELKGRGGEGDGEWVIHATLDAADALLRGGDGAQVKRAAGLLAELMNEAATRKSAEYPRALYLLGHADFLLRDYTGAGRALAQLAPFADPNFGMHARYLLARVHHQSNERPEALALYQAIEADFAAARKRAAEALREPAKLSREQRKYYESLTGATPAYVFRAGLYSGVILAQAGKNAEAQDALVKLVRANPGKAIADEAQLWQGLCQLQVKNFNEAGNLLEPLRENAAFGDQARWWAARARVLAADPANAQAYAQTAAAAVENLRAAAKKADELAKAGDGDAKLRRADILLDLADTQQLAKQYKAAAETYGVIAGEFAAAAPDRAEQAAERQVTALHLGGDFAASDAAAAKFEATYPASTLMAGVVFREAENAYLPAVAGTADAAKLGAAEKKYQRVIEKFPDFAYANLARAGMGQCQYRRGDYAAAAATLAAIPDAERVNDLAVVNYLLGDCLLRALPAETEDALSASRLLDEATRAAKLLTAFAAGNDKNPQAGDAVLKAAMCYQRVAGVLADPAERKKNLISAREMLDRAMNMVGKDAGALAVAVLERSRVNALLGDAGAAMNDLRGFERNEKLKGSPNAPLAALRLATLLRAAGKPTDAAELMRTARERDEAALLKDKVRAAWAPAMMYEHALALKEAGKVGEGRAMFEALAKQYAGQPEALNAAWRAAQCRREEVSAALAEARKNLARPGVKPEELAAAHGQIDEAVKSLRAAVEAMRAQGEALLKAPGAQGRDAAAHLLYEAAWGYRTLAEAEVAGARQQIQAEAMRRIMAKAPERSGLRPPEVALADVPAQPGEELARKAYGRVIEAAPDTDLATRARVELAELLAQRGQHEAALELLADALEKSPGEDVADRIRVRMAGSLLARGGQGSAGAALARAKTVVARAQSPVRGEALYFAAEACISGKDWAGALESLIALRDNAAYAKLPDMGDRAMLRLAQAQRELGKPDEARSTLEQMVQRFPASPWADEAYFQIAQTQQGQKNYDGAVAMYNEVTKRTVAEIAAKAQLQIGLIRLEQKNFKDAARALVAVSLTYDYPAITPHALVEAARAYVELKQPEEARRLLTEVIKTSPNTQWAQAAEKRLTEIR